MDAAWSNFLFQVGLSLSSLLCFHFNSSRAVAQASPSLSLCLSLSVGPQLSCSPHFLLLLRRTLGEDIAVTCVYIW